MQVYWLKWCQLALSLVNMSTNAYCFAYKLGVWEWEPVLHTTPKQIAFFRGYSGVIFSAASIGLKNWKLCYRCSTKNNDCFSVDGVCNHCNAAFEAMGRHYQYCPCQEARLSLSDGDIERAVKKRKRDEMHRDYIQQKGFQIVEIWECKRWSL